MASSITLLPSELVDSILSHVLADAILGDLYQGPSSRASSPLTCTRSCIVTITNLGSVCSLWRDHLSRLLQVLLRSTDMQGDNTALRSAGVEHSPLSFQIYLESIVELRETLHTSRSTEMSSFRSAWNPLSTNANTNGPLLTPPIFGTPPLHAAAFPWQTQSGLPSSMHTLPPLHVPHSPSLVQGLPSFPSSAPAHHSTHGHGTHIAFIQTLQPAVALPLAYPTSLSPVFALASLYARADSFRQTFRGDSEGRVDQSCRISAAHAAGALDCVGYVKGMLATIKVEAVRSKLAALLVELEEDVRMASLVCQWKETLQQTCLTPNWDHELALAASDCFFDMERNLTKVTVPLLLQTDLILSIRQVCTAQHLSPIEVRGHTVDLKARARHLSTQWTSKIFSWSGSALE